MPQNTRSRPQGKQQTPPVLLRRSRRSHASRTSYRESNSQRQGESFTEELGHTSAAFSPLENPLENPGCEHEISSAPVSTHHRDKSSPSKGRDVIKDSMNIVPPAFDPQGICQTAPQQADGESQPEGARIIHFDFSKYTPGRSESHPIKIEDSPKASSLLATSSQSTPAHKTLISPGVSRPDVSAIHDNFQFSDASHIEKAHYAGSLFISLPADLGPPIAVASIITSPKAATAFLKCFLAAEERWLRSCDHDMDPDIKFWKHIMAKFNANPYGYRVDTWRTARDIAVTLCGQPYKTQVQKQLPDADAELSPLVTAIMDCRHMSERRRWGYLKIAKTSTTSDMAVEDNLQNAGLEIMPRTIEERDGLMEALRKAQSGKSSKTETDGSKTRPGPRDQNEDAGARPQLHAAILDGAPRGPRTARRDFSRGFKGRMRDGPPGGYPCPSSGGGGGGNRGGRSSSRYTLRLEKRVADLERMVGGRGRPRYSR
ncbi:hypothetical protein F5Y10DRAFT_288960 [Nemania abortiva]|nr:hypothetical protein F5Y10DRAFT_288960 [Nemania abortiva]